jgi:putative tryptophan/tyrosine transport system substrate-binding protein
LRELGYIEGKNILIEYLSAEERLDRLPELMDELIQLKVSLVVTSGPPATRAATRKTSTLPIIMAFDTDPVGNGFVASLGDPEGISRAYLRCLQKLAARDWRF